MRCSFIALIIAPTKIGGLVVFILWPADLRRLTGGTTLYQVFVMKKDRS